MDGHPAAGVPSRAGHHDVLCHGDEPRPEAPLFAFSTLACPEWVAARGGRARGRDGLRRHRVAGWPGRARGAAAPRRRATRAAGRDGRPGPGRHVGDHVHRLRPSRMRRCAPASVDELVGHAEVAAVLGAPCLRAFPGERADDAPVRGAARPGSRRPCCEPPIGSPGSGIVHRHRAPRRRSWPRRLVAGLLARIDHPQVGRHLGRRQHLVLGEAARGSDSRPLGPWLRYVQVKDGIGPAARLAPDPHGRGRGARGRRGRVAASARPSRDPGVHRVGAARGTPTCRPRRGRAPGGARLPALRSTTASMRHQETP